MNRTFESIGLIGGYDIISINKTKANKDSLFKEINMVDKKVQNNVIKALDNNGLVYAIVKKNIIKGIYIFEGSKRILTLVSSYFTNELTDKIITKYNNILLNVCKEYVSFNDYEKIVFFGEEIVVNTGMDPKKKLIAIGISTIAGFIFGVVVFRSIIHGIIYGLLFAVLFNGAETLITKVKKK